MDLAGDMLRALFALMVTVGLIVGAAWLARRYGLMQAMPKSVTQRLALVEQIALDQGRVKLAVVRWDGREHLLAITPGGVAALGSAEAAEAAEAAAAPASEPAP